MNHRYWKAVALGLLTIMLTLQGITTETTEVKASVLSEVVADTSDIVERGVCGENVTYTLTQNGTLTISGTGAMYDYGSAIKSSPFKGREEIVAVIISDGVESIADDAFQGCGALTDLEIPCSLSSENAFGTSENIIHKRHGAAVTDAMAVPTCTDTGLTEGSQCSVCGEVFVEQHMIPALGHTEEVENGVSATCTESGVTEIRRCSVCGLVLVQQQTIPALGHTYGPWKVRTAATMTRTGVKVRSCTRCDKEETATIAKLATPYVKLDKTKFVYNAKVQRPKVKYVKIGTLTLSPTYYKVTYRNDKLVGIGTVMVQGIGKYSAYSRSLNYTIIPQKAAIASLKSTKAGTALIGWNKVYGGITGYQIQYATNSKFTGGKAVLAASPTKLSRGVTSLKRKKTYYFRVRAYKKIGTKTVFGAWSYVKKCVVK